MIFDLIDTGSKNSKSEKERIKNEAKVAEALFISSSK